MKPVVALARILVLATLTAVPLVHAYEEPDYEVVTRTEDYEIRRYAPYLVAQTRVEGDFGASGGQAFRILADYIFGNNDPGRKMAMTAPVISEAPGRRGGIRMAMTTPVISRPDETGGLARPGRDKAQMPGYVYQFVMERKYDLDTLPTPVDKRVEIVQVPARHLAALRFSGRWTEKRISDHTDRLFAALERDGVTWTGTALLARYDPPIKPWFMRRNEVLVEVRIPQ